MNLGARITRLETVTRERQAQPCRWCGTSWSYPDDFPPLDGVRPPMPTCEAPERCPGGGLLVVISDDKVVYVAADRTLRTA